MLVNLKLNKTKTPLSPFSGNIWQKISLNTLNPRFFFWRLLCSCLLSQECRSFVLISSSRVSWFSTINGKGMITLAVKGCPACWKVCNPGLSSLRASGTYFHQGGATKIGPDVVRCAPGVQLLPAPHFHVENQRLGQSPFSLAGAHTHTHTCMRACVHGCSRYETVSRRNMGQSLRNFSCPLPDPLTFLQISEGRGLIVWRKRWVLRLTTWFEKCKCCAYTWGREFGKWVGR